MLMQKIFLLLQEAEVLEGGKKKGLLNQRLNLTLLRSPKAHYQVGQLLLYTQNCKYEKNQIKSIGKKNIKRKQVNSA